MKQASSLESSSPQVKSHSPEREFEALQKIRYFIIAANILINVLLGSFFSWYPYEVARTIFIGGMALIFAIKVSKPALDVFHTALIIMGAVSGAILACHGHSMLNISEYISLTMVWIVAMLAKPNLGTSLWFGAINLIAWTIYWMGHSSYICEESEKRSHCPNDCKSISEIALFFCVTVIALANAIGLLSHRTILSAELRTVSKALAELSQKQRTLSLDLYNFREARENFILRFSHELKNPINSIIGNIDLALHENIPRQFSELIMNAKTSGEQLLYTVNNILDSHKLEIRTIDLNPSRCRIDSFLESFWKVASSLIEAKGLHGELLIDWRFPKYIQIDQQRMSQILMNLVCNAVSSISHGQVTLKISFEQEKKLNEDLFKTDSILDYDDLISERASITQPPKTHGSLKKPGETYKSTDNGYYKLNLWKKKFHYEDFFQPSQACKGFLRVEVIDTGCGLTGEQTSKVFDKFSGAIKQASADSGMELWIAKGLCVAMGGDIRVKSQRGVGTTFIACIRAQSAPSVEMPLSSLTKMLPCTEISPGLGPKIRVIVADDIEYNREVNSKMLKKAGVEDVCLAINGKEAVQKYRSRPEDYYTAIFMDLDMPEMNGIEACEAIREFERESSRKKIPIIIVTGNASDQKRKACLDPNGKIQASTFVVKPLMVSTLHSIFSDLKA